MLVLFFQKLIYLEILFPRYLAILLKNVNSEATA